jgi:hypothetical protein
MAPVKTPQFDSASIAQLAAVLSMRPTGAYAFVAYANTPIDVATLQVRGFKLECRSRQSGVEQYFSTSQIPTRQRGAKPRPAFREVKGRFFVAKLLTPNAYVFVTPERDEYVHDGLVRFLYRSRSHFTRARLTSTEMREIVFSLARSTNSRVETNRYVLRSKRDQATISYQTESLQTLYDFARTHDATVQGFDFTLVGTDRQMLLRAGFNRDGKLSYHRGSKEFFVRAFVEAVAQTVKTRADALNNRARSVETGEVKPLRLKFDRTLFDEPRNVRAFLTALNHVRHTDYTLLHRNPYLHLSFVDFFDASGFDVLVDSADSLVIVPQFRASRSSLFRLCQKIFDRFEEGKILEADDVIKAASVPSGWDE